MATNVSSHFSDTSSSLSPPHHLNPTDSSNQLNKSHDPEKTGHHDTTPIAMGDKRNETTVDEEEDEDMDTLIEDLESDDDLIIDEVEEKTDAGVARSIPEELLGTSVTQGLTNAEVLTRRKKYGLNQMKEEKQNMILKFLGYFVGPIQFVMEVGFIARIPPLIFIEPSGVCETGLKLVGLRVKCLC